MDHVVHATGSAGTQAGLAVALRGSNSGVPVYGVSVRAPKEKQAENVWKLVWATIACMGLPGSSVDRGDVATNAAYLGRGYAVPTDSLGEGGGAAAHVQGQLLVPAYTRNDMPG